MKNINLRNRFGGATVTIVVVLIVIIAIAAGSLYYSYISGKELQDNQARLWNEAFMLFNQKQPEAAYLKLIEARSTFCDTLEFYRKIASGTYHTKAELNEAIVLICQSEAYDKLFVLESADSWINYAKLEINNVDDPETRVELANFISRAEIANNLCSTYLKYIQTPDLPDEKYQELVKSSLRVGNEALTALDYDYAIFEVRFLIACGKSFDEPILVDEARKQLFYITQAQGEDEKTTLLWGLLSN